jgi:tol-pal system protein YbgF
MTATLTGCLKTRAQLKDDEEDRPHPVAAQVHEVQPQGQYVIDEIKSEITRMTGRIEELERTDKQDEGKASGSKEQLAKLETRVQELEQAQAQMIEAIKKMQSAPAPLDAGTAFEKGRKHFEDGDDDEAIKALSQYLKSGGEKHAEEATFLRGEAYYRQKQFKKAIVDYSQFPEKWKRSKRMPSALLRIANSFEALGMKEDAQGFYQEVVEKYPKSPEAKKAKARVKGKKSG